MSKFHEEELHIVMTPDPKAEQGYTLSLVPGQFIWYCHSDHINLGTTTVTKQLEIPGRAELTKLAIETLQNKQQHIAAEAFKKQQELQDKIDVLLLLEAPV